MGQNHRFIFTATPTGTRTATHAQRFSRRVSVVRPLLTAAAMASLLGSGCFSPFPALILPPAPGPTLCVTADADVDRRDGKNPEELAANRRETFLGLRPVAEATPAPAHFLACIGGRESSTPIFQFVDEDGGNVWVASATASFILDEGMPNVLANAPFDLEVSISRGHLGLPRERLVATSSANPRLPLFAFQFGFTEREPTAPIEVGGLTVRGESAEGPPTVGDCGTETPWLVTISGDFLPSTVSVSTGADVTVEGAQVSVDISYAVQTENVNSISWAEPKRLNNQDYSAAKRPNCEDGPTNGLRIDWVARTP